MESSRNRNWFNIVQFSVTNYSCLFNSYISWLLLFYMEIKLTSSPESLEKCWYHWAYDQTTAPLSALLCKLVIFFRNFLNIENTLADENDGEFQTKWQDEAQRVSITLFSRIVEHVVCSFQHSRFLAASKSETLSLVWSLRTVDKRIEWHESNFHVLFTPSNDGEKEASCC